MSFDHDHYPDSYLRQVLRDVKSIAMVGASANWNRPSYFAMKYLLDHGYRVHPVNPGAAGQEILGQKAYASLDDLRRQSTWSTSFNSEAAGPITDEPSSMARRWWMQLTVRNDGDEARRGRWPARG